MKPLLEQPYDLKEVRAALTKGGLVKRDADLSLEAYPPAFSRHPQSRRWHFRVAVQKQAVCHLIAGLDLAGVYDRADGIFKACPDLICRPLLFWERNDQMGFLCLEHFPGESMDVLVKNGRCTASQWVTLARRAQTLLARTRQPSTAAALEREIQALLEDVCSFPGLSPLDVRLLRELAQPAILQEAISGPIASQWSNGDFTGRNLLVDEQGRIRLVDYEYAGPTHFGPTDWLSLKQFSVLPADLDENTIPELRRAQTPAQETRFWLHHLAQLKSAKNSPEVARHTAEAVSQLFAALRQSAPGESGRRTKSLLIELLSDHQSQTKSALQERTSWAQSLETELQQSRAVSATQAKLVEERTSWAQSLETELQQSRTVSATQAKLVEERTSWAQALQNELATAQGHLNKLTQEFAERTSWAQSLETELQQSRTVSATQAKLVEERTSWAQALQNELATAQGHLNKLTQEFAERTSWAQSLEAELQQSRTVSATQAKLVEERTSWARSLDAELQKTRDDFQNQAQASAELTKQRDRLVAETTELGRLQTKLESNLSRVKDVCAALAPLMDVDREKGEVALLEQVQSVLADLRYQIAVKNAEIRSAAAISLETQLRVDVAESEVRRLTAVTKEAQLQLDGLLLHTSRLQQLSNRLTTAEQDAAAQLRRSMAELLSTRAELARYESRLICRLAARAPISTPPTPLL